MRTEIHSQDRARLTRETFFYVGQDNYDDLVELSLPHYLEGHDLIAQILRTHSRGATSALDLGSGSGYTAQVVLEALPSVKLTGLDLFESMLHHARRRLAPWQDRVELVVADNSEWLEANPDARFDIVTSAFCIHHLDADGKRALFRAIRRVLKPGGLFLMLDLSTFDNPTLRSMARSSTEQYMLARVTDPQAREEWLHHWNFLNLPDTSDNMVAWMRAAGLESETVARWWEVVFCVGGVR